MRQRNVEGGSSIVKQGMIANDREDIKRFQEASSSALAKRRRTSSASKTQVTAGSVNHGFIHSADVEDGMEMEDVGLGQRQDNVVQTNTQFMKGVMKRMDAAEETKRLHEASIKSALAADAEKLETTKQKKREESQQAAMAKPVDALTMMDVQAEVSRCVGVLKRTHGSVDALYQTAKRGVDTQIADAEGTVDLTAVKEEVQKKCEEFVSNFKHLGTTIAELETRWTEAVTKGFTTQEAVCAFKTGLKRVSGEDFRKNEQLVSAKGAVKQLDDIAKKLVNAQTKRDKEAQKAALKSGKVLAPRQGDTIELPLSNIETENIK